MSGAGALAPYLPVHRYGLGDLLHEQARSRPGRLAAIDGTHRISFRELDDRVNRLAAVLRECGAVKGDRVLWIGQNSFRVIEVLLASARIGVIFCPANWRASAAEIRDILEDLDPRVVFWQEAEIGEANRKARGLWEPHGCWVRHDGAGPDDYEARVARADAEDRYDAIEPSTPLLAIYTAAFSGRPNAALLSHEALILTGTMHMFGQAIGEESGYLVSGPMFHVGVLMGTIGTFIAGGRLAFVPRVEARELLGMIERERLTHAYIPQPTLEQMRERNRAREFDVSSLFSSEDMSDWKFPLVMPASAPMLRNHQGYGQTEIGGLVVMAWLGGSACGKPFPFLQIRIADEDGNEVAAGATGEILARGPLVMCGYWNRPEENRRRVIAGWHRTNDLGRRLPDGSIAFVGPKTTMIKSGLENIYPAEVENCLRLHQSVADVCVIGVPDATWVQNVKAVVVRMADARTSAEELIEHCRRHIASYKKPKIIEFVDALPRGANGALDRSAIDARHGGGGYPSVQ